MPPLPGLLIDDLDGLAGVEIPPVEAAALPPASEFVTPLVRAPAVFSGT
jgi:hypothetical protein